MAIIKKIKKTIARVTVFTKSLNFLGYSDTKKATISVTVTTLTKS